MGAQPPPLPSSPAIRPHCSRQHAAAPTNAPPTCCRAAGGVAEAHGVHGESHRGVSGSRWGGWWALQGGLGLWQGDRRPSWGGMGALAGAPHVDLRCPPSFPPVPGDYYRRRRRRRRTAARVGNGCTQQAGGQALGLITSYTGAGRSRPRGRDLAVGPGAAASTATAHHDTQTTACRIPARQKRTVRQ